MQAVDAVHKLGEVGSQTHQSSTFLRLRAKFQTVINPTSVPNNKIQQNNHSRNYPSPYSVSPSLNALSDVVSLIPPNNQSRTVLTYLRSQTKCPTSRQRRNVCVGHSYVAMKENYEEEIESKMVKNP